jgi:hypothetical protein
VACYCWALPVGGGGHEHTNGAEFCDAVVAC